MLAEFASPRRKLAKPSPVPEMSGQAGILRNEWKIPRTAVTVSLFARAADTRNQL